MIPGAWVDVADFRPLHVRRKARRQERAAGSSRYYARQTVIPPGQWPEVARVAEAVGLRAAAQQYGVSHETVRKITQAVVMAST